jgi:mono/diheme cytochrome c family protein
MTGAKLTHDQPRKARGSGGCLFIFVALVALTLANITAPMALQPAARTNPLANDPAASAAGQKLFEESCLACHGPAGQGDQAPALNRANFTLGESDDAIFQTIRDGVRSGQMPPFKELTDELKAASGT